MSKTEIPSIRFCGFDDAWEQCEFDEVFDCTVPNNTLSRAELSYDEGTVLNVHYGDVLIKYKASSIKWIPIDRYVWIAKEIKNDT